ncbi:MAG TPA: histidinol-phosphate transaminase [Candidatus Binatia bacterium]|nr:histidinol-phosphate transaminase [Candidatus Binatia bacterium]
MKIVEHVPEYIRSLIPYEPGKPIEEVEREYGISGSLKLASNENPLGPSPRALAVLRERLPELHLYPDGDCFYLKRALARKLGVQPDRLIFGNGSNEIIELAARTFMRPGDEAVMAEQAFVVYELIVQAVGGKRKTVPLKNFTHDLAAIADAVTPQTRLVFLANPNNPTGTIYRRRDWEAFLERISPDVLIIVDEAYFEYVEEADYPNSLDYHARHPAILTLRTFSKLYGLAGLRIGYGIGAKDVIALMQRVRQPFNVNAPAQWAALAALDDSEHVQRSLGVNQQGVKYLQTEFARLGLSYVPSQANFILVRVGNGHEVFQRLLQQGVIVRPMVGYKFPEHVRVTVGTMAQNQKLISALERLIQAS